MNTNTKKQRRVTIIVTVLLGLSTTLLSVGSAQATALFETRAALFITFTGVSAGIDGTDYSVGSSQPFTPQTATTGSGDAGTIDDVFPGGNSGWDVGETFRVDVQASGAATLPGGTAQASVLGAFDVTAQNFSSSLSSITFNFDYQYILTGTVTPGDPNEYARSFGNVGVTLGLIDLVDVGLDLSTVGGPLTQTLTNTGSFNLIVNQLASETVNGVVNALGEAQAPAPAPVPTTLLLMIIAVPGLIWRRRRRRC